MLYYVCTLSSHPYNKVLLVDVAQAVDCTYFGQYEHITTSSHPPMWQFHKNSPTHTYLWNNTPSKVCLHLSKLSTERDLLHALWRLPGNVYNSHKFKFVFLYMKVLVKARAFTPLCHNGQLLRLHTPHKQQYINVSEMRNDRFNMVSYSWDFG